MDFCLDCLTFHGGICKRDIRIGQYVKQSKNPLACLYVFCYTSEEETFYKIGITNNLQNREKQLNKSCIKLNANYSIKLLFAIRSTSRFVAGLEYDLHRIFSRYKVLPKFSVSGYTECFSTTSGLLTYIPFSQVEVITDLLSQQEIAA